MSKDRSNSLPPIQFPELTRAQFYAGVGNIAFYIPLDARVGVRLAYRENDVGKDMLEGWYQGMTTQHWEAWQAPGPLPVPAMFRELVGQYFVDSNSSPFSSVFFWTGSPPAVEEWDEDLSATGFPVFKGGGAPGTAVRLINNLTKEYLSELKQISSDGKWVIAISEHLSGGSILAEMKYEFAHYRLLPAYSAPIQLPFYIPVITAPEGIQETTFTLSGIDARKGGSVIVYREFSGVVGMTPVLSTTVWSTSITLPPGPNSLVVFLSVDGIDYPRGSPRAFKIRPPTLQEPTVTYSGTTVTFSGNGYYDPALDSEIHFTIDDGPGQVPAPANVEVTPDGTWQTPALQWPLGTYKVTVIQKIADNASGWIDSHACQFDVKHWIPQVSEVTHTPTYRPVFSGKGYTGATVRFIRPDGWEIAPSTVVVNERWSSATLDELGPTKDQTIGIHQSIANVGAPEPLVYSFSIPPQAPGLNDPQENGQSPIFTGTCWPGAEVLLAFNGDGRYVAETDEGQWRYEKPGGFVPGQYTVSVTQIAAEQESVAVRKDFTVSRSVLKPQIDTPLEGAVVAADLIVTGSNGMAGASMQLRDAQYGNALGQPLDLTANGPWSINLTDLSRRWYTIDAQQTLEEQKSEPSDPRAFTVALLAPQITVPEQDGTMPRDGRIEGTGWRGAYVEIWDVDANVQLAADIEVQPDGSWHWELKQLTGPHQLWARQAFAGTRSEESPIRSYRVVPNAPSIETPTADDHVGRRVWVCGFGVPGDKVLATLGDARGEAVVADNRTWSMLLNLSVAGGNHALQVIASSAEFQSEPTLQQLAVGTYLPVIEAPQPGRQVDRNPWFRGHGRPGVGQLVSWFNPEVVWLEHVPVDGGQWQGQSGQSLPAGGTWCWFHQTLTDDQGETVSERVLSSRFEVDAGDAPAKQRR